MYNNNKFESWVFRSLRFPLGSSRFFAVLPKRRSILFNKDNKENEVLFIAALKAICPDDSVLFGYFTFRYKIDNVYRSYNITSYICMDLNNISEIYGFINFLYKNAYIQHEDNEISMDNS